MIAVPNTESCHLMEQHVVSLNSTCEITNYKHCLDIATAAWFHSQH